MIPLWGTGVWEYWSKWETQYSITPILHYSFCFYWIPDQRLRDLGVGSGEILLLVDAGDLVAALLDELVQALDSRAFLGIRSEVQDLGDRAVLPTLDLHLRFRHLRRQLGRAVGDRQSPVAGPLILRQQMGVGPSGAQARDLEVTLPDFLSLKLRACTPLRRALERRSPRRRSDRPWT